VEPPAMMTFWRLLIALIVINDFVEKKCFDLDYEFHFLWLIPSLLVMKHFMN